MKKSELAAYIDQTILKPGVTEAFIREFCSEAAQNQFASVCVLPYLVPACAKTLAGSATKVCTVLGFPLGDYTPEQALFEAQDAISSGAQELDLVLNLYMVKSDPDAAFSAVSSVAKLAHQNGCLLKLIIETPLLTPGQITDFAARGEHAGADIIKTSTGYTPVLPRATTVEDVKLIKSSLKKKTGIKASGGIRTTNDALAMIEAGATRIGASSGVQILEGLE